MPIEVLEADLTTLAVDAVVNAANPTLLGGGGVDGAIHRAAGPELLAECLAQPEVRPGVRCPTGQARLTGGHRLPACHVIHTVRQWLATHALPERVLFCCFDAAMAERYRRALATAPGTDTTDGGAPCA